MLRLLGSPKILTNDTWQTMSSRWPTLLCAFLCSADEWVNRSELMLLFWPEESEHSARNRLRQLLFKSKSEPWKAYLQSQPEQLRLTLKSDLVDFRQHIHDQNWSAAIKLYKGDFLEGTYPKRDGHYWNWLSAEQEALKAMWKQAILARTNELEQEHDYSSALNLLNKLLQRDFLSEDALQIYLRISITIGQKQQALKVFNSFQTTLKNELTLSPLPETLSLAAQLQSTQAQKIKTPTKPNNLESKTQDFESHVTEHSSHLHSIPNYASTFVGRDIELVELLNLFEQGSRLVSLIGTGGIGKTRLAVQLAREKSQIYADGIVFVSLADLTSTDLIATTILKALKFLIRKEQSPLEGLLSYLNTKNMLLILDNFEHLLSATPMIQEIIKTTEKVDVLVTSREPLACPGETIFPIGGLSYPNSKDDVRFENYDSVQLFLRAARRNKQNFELSEQDKPAILAICQKLEGLPLGIELISSWVRLMSISEISEQLELNLDVLISPNTQTQGRHQSWQSIVEHSWKLLNQNDQLALKKFSVFQGGADLKAAKELNNLRSLLSLTHKSLLRRDSNGRFTSHLLVQQFAYNFLLHEPNLLEEVKTAHASYFLNLAESQEKQLDGFGQQAALKLLEHEHDNLRAALNWTLINNEKLALRFCVALGQFWLIKGHSVEGKRYLTQVLSKEIFKQKQTLTKQSLYLAKAKTLLGKYFAWSNYEEAYRLFEESLLITQALNDEQNTAITLNELAFLEIQRGKYAQARKYCEKSELICKTLSNKHTKTTNLLLTGVVDLFQGNYLQAQSKLEQSANFFEHHGDTIQLAASYQQLANIGLYQENYDTALSYFKKSAALSNKLGHIFNLADINNSIAVIYMKKRDFKQALPLFEISKSQMQELNDEDGLGYVFDNLGLIAREQKRFDEAKKYFKQSLSLRRKLGRQRGITSIFNRIASLLALQEKPQQAAFFWGAAERILKDTNGILQPAYQDYYLRDTPAVKTSLGSTAYKKFWQEGFTMPLSEAINYALELLS